MLNYLRSLPDRDLGQRRRFVVVATAVVFGVIIIAYILLRTRGRDISSAPEPTSSPRPSAPLSEISAAPIDLPLVLPSPVPTTEAPEPLIRPSPTSVPTARATPTPTGEPTL